MRTVAQLVCLAVVSFMLAGCPPPDGDCRKQAIDRAYATSALEDRLPTFAELEVAKQTKETDCDDTLYSDDKFYNSYLYTDTKSTFYHDSSTQPGGTPHPDVESAVEVETSEYLSPDRTIVLCIDEDYDGLATLYVYDADGFQSLFVNFAYADKDWTFQYTVEDAYLDPTVNDDQYWYFSEIDIDMSIFPDSTRFRLEVVDNVISPDGLVGLLSTGVFQTDVVVVDEHLYFSESKIPQYWTGSPTVYAVDDQDQCRNHVEEVAALAEATAQ